MTAPLRDNDLRTALSAAVQRQHRGRDFVLVPEVDIVCGIPGRIDALLVSDRICGFELKSDVDSLHRLPRQLQAYEPVLERATLIVGARHLARAETLLPPWWAIWVARRGRGGAVVFDRKRPGRPNPELITNAVMRFLSRDDLTRHFRTQGFKGYSKYSVDELRDQLVDRHSHGQAMALARWAMQGRGDWRYRDGALCHPPNPDPADRPPSWMNWGPTRCECPLCRDLAGVR